MTTEVAIRQTEIGISDLRAVAVDFAKSGYFADAREISQAVVKIFAGRELGLGPVYSMTHIYIVKGKIAIAAEVMGALIKKTNRYDYQVKKLDDEECILMFTDNNKEAYTSKFTMTDARRAGLITGGSGWEKWPRAMLMSKALSQGARIVCPHVIAGAYTPEDFGMEANAEGDYQQPVTVVTEVKDESQTITAPAPATVEMCTEAQRKKIFASGKQMGYTEDILKTIVKVRFGKQHTADLTKLEAVEFIEAIAAGKSINDQGEWITT
jgi:hypothetical protein